MVDIGHKLLALQAENSELLAAAQRGWALEKTLQASHREAQAVARERDQLQVERDALARLLSLGDDGAGEDHRATACNDECVRCEHLMPRSRGNACSMSVAQRAAGTISRARRPSRGAPAAPRWWPGRVAGTFARHDQRRRRGGLPDRLRQPFRLLPSQRQCKRSGKPCLLFKGASVSGFAVALARLASGQFRPAGGGRGCA